jgi:hypothetical protein
MAKVTSVIDVPNSLATVPNTKTRRKKSKASKVQPRTLAIAALRPALVHGDVPPTVFALSLSDPALIVVMIDTLVR